MLILLERIRLERLLREFSGHPVRAVFKIDVQTCTISEIIKLNSPNVRISAYKNASPEKLIRNRNAASLCRAIIQSVHATGFPQTVQLPITLPTPYPENICAQVYFKKGPSKHTVLAISISEGDFL